MSEATIVVPPAQREGITEILRLMFLEDMARQEVAS